MHAWMVQHQPRASLIVDKPPCPQTSAENGESKKVGKLASSTLVTPRSSFPAGSSPPSSNCFEFSRRRTPTDLISWMTPSSKINR